MPTYKKAKSLKIIIEKAVAMFDSGDLNKYEFWNEVYIAWTRSDETLNELLILLEDIGGFSRSLSTMRLVDARHYCRENKGPNKFFSSMDD